MLVRTRPSSNGEIVTLRDVVENNVPIEELRVLREVGFTWLDEYVLEWHTAICTRPHRICREYADRIAALIDIEYVDRTSRQQAIDYARNLLTHFMDNQTELDKNLQRIESELSLSCDPRRILELRKTKELLVKKRLDEIVKNGKIVDIHGAANGNKQTAA